jgi:hypothetical protein
MQGQGAIVKSKLMRRTFGVPALTRRHCQGIDAEFFDGSPKLSSKPVSLDGHQRLLASSGMFFALAFNATERSEHVKHQETRCELCIGHLHCNLGISQCPYGK